MKSVLFLLSLAFSLTAMAASPLEGTWHNEDGGKEARFIEFEGRLTLNTRAYYANGAPSDYFFEFSTPRHRDPHPGEVFPGRLRSLDGYYGCVFDQSALLKYARDGKLQLDFPRLVFKKVTRSSRQKDGTHYQRQVDWTRWGWVETIYKFPIYRWRVISSECVVTNKINTTVNLVR